LINGTATFYASRIRPTTTAAAAATLSPPPSPSYTYDQVMGPDEFAYPVNNSGYTNRQARVTLSFAAEAAAILGYTADPPPAGSVYADFAQKGKGLAIPFADTVPGRPDLKGGYHPEYASYGTDASKLTVKQADTVMLSYPLGVDMPKDVLANDLKYYSEHTVSDGPAMTCAIFAIGWFTTGNYSYAASGANFQRGYANVQPPFNVWTETPGGGTVNFITGAGGFLQSVLFGTSGMRLAADHLSFAPPPPNATGSAASKFTIHSMHFQGSTLRHDVTAAGTMTFTLLRSDPGAPQLQVSAEGSDMATARILRVGVPVSFPRTPGCILTKVA
jgi:protein-glucosylgalactosylhydroxylysine glucosidase